MNQRLKVQGSLNRELVAPAGLARAVQDLSAFCAEVEQRSESAELRRAAAQKTQLLQQLDTVLDHFFLHELRNPLTDLAPEAEIFRKSTGASSDFSELPLFIVGSRRSGTTLLSHLLNAGEQIAALPESFLASVLAGSDGLMRAGLQTKRSLEEPFPSFLRRLGQLADAVYRDYARRQGKERWVSKELLAESKLDILDAMFDYRGKFIHAVRHGLDVAWSCACRFPMRDGIPDNPRSSLSIVTYLDKWITVSEAVADFVERNPTRSLTVRYEDLTEDPAGWGQRLFDFSEQTWAEGTLMRMQEQRLGESGDNKIFRAGGKVLQRPQSAWHDWPTPLLRQLGRRANPTLTRLGYQPI